MKEFALICFLFMFFGASGQTKDSFTPAKKFILDLKNMNDMPDSTQIWGMLVKKFQGRKLSFYYDSSVTYPNEKKIFFDSKKSQMQYWVVKGKFQGDSTEITRINSENPTRKKHLVYSADGLYHKSYINDTLTSERKIFLNSDNSVMKEVHVEEGNVVLTSTVQYLNALTVSLELDMPFISKDKYKRVIYLLPSGKIEHENHYKGSPQKLTKQVFYKYDDRGNKISSKEVQAGKTTDNDSYKYDFKNRLVETRSLNNNYLKREAFDANDSLVGTFEIERGDTSYCRCKFSLNEKICSVKDKWSFTLEKTIFNPQGKPVQFIVLKSPENKDTVETTLYTYTNSGLPLTKYRKFHTRVYTTSWEYGPDENSWIKKIFEDGILSEEQHVKFVY